jgi:hypothetical protein
MALEISKKVNYNGLSREGCYIQIKPHLDFGSKKINCDRGIWADKADFENNPTQPTISALKEIPNSFTVHQTETVILKAAEPFKPAKGNEPEVAAKPAETKENNIIPDDNFATDVLNKYLYWICEQCKAELLALNPTWEDSDIEIVDIK